MSEYFNENRKFLGLKGIIGRRDFISNWLLIEVFEALFYSTPITIFLLANPQYLSTFKPGWALPVWGLIWVAATGVISAAFYYSSITRRVRDIIGEEDDSRVNSISAILTLIILFGYTPIIAPVFKYTGLIMLVILSVMKGKITGEKSPSEIVRFNWGAFLGTWLWGIYNRCPKTLWMIPLTFTFGALPFALICGIKGNEWAYEHKKDKNIEEFHKSQAFQAVIWTVLAPLIFIITSLLSTFIVGGFLYNYSKVHPEFVEQTKTEFIKYQEKAINAAFDKIEEKNGVYNFYLTPQTWAAASSELKEKSYLSAVDYVILKETKNVIQDADLSKYIKYMSRVRILSSFNNEVLAEFEPSDEIKTLEKTSKETRTKRNIITALRKGYKFNTYPTLP